MYGLNYIYAHFSWSESSSSVISQLVSKALRRAGNMLRVIFLATFLLHLSVCSNNAAAVPVSIAGKVYPKVIPDPRLPSLASLGLTSARLYQSKDARDCLLRRN